MMTYPSSSDRTSASAFRIRRPIITASGYVAEVDANVKGHLEELDTLLQKAVFPRPESASLDDTSYGAESSSEGAPPPSTESGSRKRRKPRVPLGIGQILDKDLTPKKVPANTWASYSLLYALNAASTGAGTMSLTDYINTVPELTQLKYAFTAQLDDAKYTLPFNVNAVLEGHPGVIDYLVAYAWHRLGVQDPIALLNTVMKHEKGVQQIIDYVTVSAARSRIDLEQLAVQNANDDDSTLVKQLKAAKLPLSATAFAKSADAVIDNFIFNSKEEQIIDAVEADIGEVPDPVRPKLIARMKHSPVKITTSNAKYWLPLFLSQISGNGAVVAETTSLVAFTDPDADFEVDYLEDSETRNEVSRSAVKCAAQLYYSMVVGDELDVFNAVNYFTHKYCVRDSIEITDIQLREDLRAYVFDGEFPELQKVDKSWVRTGKILKRTRPAERQMFYRQVFDYGDAAITEDVVVNKEYKDLWKVLMLESARYLERAQLSPHPDSFVSRTNVMQAAEDLQYNLSSNCTGMAGVIAPLVYKELQFVIHCIFENPLVINRILPEGGEWWRVVERLTVGMRRARPKARVLNNKAKLGHSIIRALADYNPATFEDDRNFSAFISTVDAFITTQSILQEALTDALKNNGNGNGDVAIAGIPGSPPQLTAGMPMPGSAPAEAEAGGAGDEWNF